MKIPFRERDRDEFGVFRGKINVCVSTIELRDQMSQANRSAQVIRRTRCSPV